MNILFTLLLLPLQVLTASLLPPYPYGQFDNLGSQTQSLCVRSITQSPDGMMWFGAEDGLYSYDGYHLQKREGAPRGMGYIKRLEAERDSLWIGYEHGQMCFSLDSHTFHPTRSHPWNGSGTDMEIDTILVGKQWWVNTMFQVAEWDKERNELGFTLPMPVAKVMCADPRGNLLVGTDNGLFIIQPNHTTHHLLHDARFGESLASDVVWSIFRDRDDNIWLGTNSGVSLARHNAPLTTYTLPAITGQSSGNQIFTIYRDGRDRLWAGGSNGILYIEQLGKDGQTYRWYRMNDPQSPLPHNRIRTIFADTQGQLWVGGDGGLLLFNEATQQFDRYHIAGKDRNWVYDIGETTKGELLITTFDASYIATPDLNNRQLDIRQQLSRKSLDRKQKECARLCQQWGGNRHYLSAYQDNRHHQLLLGGTDCFTVVNLAVPQHPHTRPTVCITDILVNGSRLVKHQDIHDASATFMPHERFLQFRFSDFSYTDLQANDYVYSINEGKDWLPATAPDHTITLAQLEAGTYELLIRPKSDSLEVAAPLFTFTIRAPWYTTPMAKTVYVLLMLTLLFATFYIVRQRRRLKKEREERAHLLAQAKQKERELLDDNEYLTNQLRLQLIEKSGNEDELSADEKFLLDITHIIEENMDDSGLNVNLLSQKSGISSKQLYRRIKALTGMTAVAYIRDQRLKKAASLLAKGSFTVSEVMYMVGFSSASYFTRCFCDEYGTPPSEYKSSRL